MLARRAILGTPTDPPPAHPPVRPRQVVIVCVVGIVWRKETWAHYMILGLALDNLARLLFGAGPSPLAQAARCAAACWTPDFRPGVPKQFASACALFMATVRGRGRGRRACAGCMPRPQRAPAHVPAPLPPCLRAPPPGPAACQP